MLNKEYLREWRKAHPNYYRDYYRNNPEKRANNYAAHKEWKKKHGKEYYATYNQSDEEKLKIKARNILNRSILVGATIRQFCEVSTCKLIGEAHHPDYSKPLEVKWLCKLHHEDIHHLIK